MLFEWDSDKDESNQQKHGISFETASRIFYDPFLITVQDNDNEEQRFKSIGSVNGIHVLMVIHTYRTDDGLEVIRIISARKISKGEVKKYGYR